MAQVRTSATTERGTRALLLLSIGLRCFTGRISLSALVELVYLLVVFYRCVCLLRIALTASVPTWGCRACAEGHTIGDSGYAIFFVGVVIL